MKEQIQSLENLVFTLMTEQTVHKEHNGPFLGHTSPSASGPTGQETTRPYDHIGAGGGGRDSVPEILSGPFGRIRIDDRETSYVGAEHWAAILDHITRVKDYFDGENDSVEDPPNDCAGPSLLIDPSRSTTKAEILSSVPDRDVADRLLSRYFNSKESAVAAIHVPTFQRQYEAFWQDPWSTPTMWIGQLLAMFSMAVLLCRRSGDALPEPLQQAEQAAETFRRRTVQCLILADYTSLVPHTLEAMLIYLHGEYAQSNDAQPGIFVTMGMVIRLALRMGYHRDPCHSPHISPFQAEMRRRMWTLVCHTDMMFASQNGLPSLVRAEQSDTRLPRNLLDDDMHEDMSELPPARPLTDPTPVAFVIVKDGIMRVYRRIVEHLATIAPSPYDNVLALDQQLQEARHAIPPYLRMRSMDQSIADPPELIIKRLYLEFGFQNARCALHRRYLSESQSRHRYAYSRSVCIEAAMRLLQHQAMLHAELQPGGQLSRESGYITSFTSHFFLTAAMIVCLELSNIGEEDGGTQREHLLDVLKRSHQIWCAESAQSHEARKVADALAVVLRNAHESNRQPWRPPIASPSSIPLFRSMALNTPTSPMAGRGCQTHSNDGVATGDVSNDQDCVGNADVNTGMTWEDMLQMPGGINWDAWDKQLDHLSFTAPAIATARS